MTTPEALKALYEALGGDPSAVSDLSKNVELLNALSLKYGGDAGAQTIPKAVENITAVAGNIGGGGGGVEPEGMITITFPAVGTPADASVTVNGIFHVEPSMFPAPPPTYEEGTHVYAVQAFGADVWKYAVPIIGEGDTAHLDCYIGFADVNMGTGANVLTVTSNAATFDRLKKGTSFVNVWHLVTANGVTTASITCTFGTT